MEFGAKMRREEMQERATDAVLSRIRRRRDREKEREKEREGRIKREKFLHPCKDLVLVHADGLGVTLRKTKALGTVICTESYLHRESVSGRWGFSLRVLIASCTANSNLEYKTPKRCLCPLPLALAVVKWNSQA